jgi:hypothetical protein
MWNTCFRGRETGLESALLQQVQSEADVLRGDCATRSNSYLGITSPMYFHQRWQTCGDNCGRHEAAGYAEYCHALQSALFTRATEYMCAIRSKVTSV